MAEEIERRFIVDEPPLALLGTPGLLIRQGYLVAEAHLSIRVRLTETTATLTVKSGQGIVRAEVDVPVPPGVVDDLWSLTAGARIDKRRHEITLPDGSIAELDQFAGTLEGLWIVEVEFPTVADARSFPVPAWFGREVTDDRAWGNAQLARCGRPDGPPTGA